MTPTVFGVVTIGFVVVALGLAIVLPEVLFR